MNRLISHDWNEDSLEEQARWFSSLSLEERMQIFDEFTEFLLSVNPSLLQKKSDAAPTETHIRIVAKE
ncbi:MAG: hypothetical protein ACRD2K_00210 [Terriglobales bacterium]